MRCFRDNLTFLLVNALLNFYMISPQLMVSFTNKRPNSHLSWLQANLILIYWDYVKLTKSWMYLWIHSFFANEFVSQLWSIWSCAVMLQMPPWYLWCSLGHISLCSCLILFFFEWTDFSGWWQCYEWYSNDTIYANMVWYFKTISHLLNKVNHFLKLFFSS